MHPLRTPLAAALAGLLLTLAACGGGGSGADSTTAGDTGSPATGDGGSASSDPHAMECAAQSYACSWGDVDAAVADRSVELAAALGERLDAGSPVTEAVTWLKAEAPGVVVEHDDLQLRFRLPQGRPVWVLRKEIFTPTPRAVPTLPAWSDRESGQAAAAHERPQRLAAAAARIAADPAALTRRLAEAGRSGRAGSGSDSKETAAAQRAVDAGTTWTSAGTGSYREQALSVVAPGVAQKQALVLSPYQYDFIGYSGAYVTELLMDTPGYAGGISYKVNTTATSTEVGVRDFTGFADNDVVFVDGHGTIMCEDKATGRPIEPCRQVVLAHRVQGAGRPVDAPDAQLPGVELAYFSSGWHLVLGADFFRDQYPQGLDHRLVYLSACKSAREADLALALHGQTGVYLGWSDTVPSDFAQSVDVWVFEGLQRGWPVQHVLEELGDKLAQPEANVELIDNDRDLRIREIVTPLDAVGGGILADGAAIEIAGQPGDGADDTVVLTAQLDGIDEEHLADFMLEISVAGEVRRRVPLLDGEKLFDGRWKLQAEVALGRDVQAGDTLDLLFSLSLPEGGSSTAAVKPVVRAAESLPERWQMEVVADSQHLFSRSRETIVVQWRRKPGDTGPRWDYVAESVRVWYDSEMEFTVGRVTCSAPVHATDVAITPSDSMTLWFDEGKGTYYSWSAWAPRTQVPIQIECNGKSETINLGIGGLLWTTGIDPRPIDGAFGSAQSGEYDTGTGTPTVYRWKLTPLR